MLKDGKKRKEIVKQLFLVHYVCDECHNSWGAINGKKCSKCGKEATDAIYYWIDHNEPLNYFSQTGGYPRCPFLKKVKNKDQYICLIHDTKPSACKKFPFLDPLEEAADEKDCKNFGCAGYFLILNHK